MRHSASMSLGQVVSIFRDFRHVCVSAGVIVTGLTKSLQYM